MPMRYDTLPADLKHWLAQSIAQGQDEAALVRALTAAGHKPGFARSAAQAALAQHKTAARFALPPPAPASASAVPVQPAEVEEGNTLATSSGPVRLLFKLNAPRVILLGGLLAEAECDQLVALARQRLARSTVVNPTTGSYDEHPDRISRGGHFQRGENALIRSIEARIAEVTGYPIQNGEPLQILHYLPGGEYKPHHDYFDPALPGNESVLAQGGQRVATLIMYLNDVAAGGSTVFPTLGLDVLPHKGNGTFFAYYGEERALDARTLHGGSPVKAGEKWIATKWIREREYSGPSA
jgi:prolyl 4-hydroxylase